MSLAAARAQVDAGDLDAALVTLLTRWRAAPHPQIADAIDAVNARVAPGRPPLDVGSGTIQQAWLARADAQDPRDLGRLLESLTAVIGRLARPRLEVLRDWPADPRLFRALHAHVRHSPWRKRSSGDPFGLLAVEMLAASGSAETYAELRVLADLNRGATSPSGLVVGGALLSTADDLATLAPEVLDAVEQVDCAAIIERATQTAVPSRGAKTVAMLFDEVYANPDDRDTRAVLADALSAQGDPRGDFIAMQMARDPGAPPSAAETRLLRQYERDWLGPLAPMLAKSRQGWRGGFLHRARLLRVIDAIDIEQSAWSTVRVLDVSTVEVSPRPSVADLLLSAHCTRIESVIGLRTRDLGVLEQDGRPMPWTMLAGVRYGGDSVESLGRLNAPRLQHFDLMEQTARLTVAWLEALVATVPTLTRIDAHLRHVRWSKLIAFPGHLREIQLYRRDDLNRRRGWSARFVKGAPTIEMAYRPGRRDVDPVETLRGLLAHQGRLPFEELKCLPSAALTDLDWAPVERQARYCGMGFTPP